mmetsp:Transcript_51985/g.136667  ORF Transcript_51985/g.136667 Transcript_51985/m.136667 type:complete len:276 (+) Transcript_51985:14-841(+)
MMRPSKCAMASSKAMSSGKQTPCEGCLKHNRKPMRTPHAVSQEVALPCPPVSAIASPALILTPHHCPLPSPVRTRAPTESKPSSTPSSPITSRFRQPDIREVLRCFDLSKESIICCDGRYTKRTVTSSLSPSILGMVCTSSCATTKPLKAWSPSCPSATERPSVSRGNEPLLCAPSPVWCVMDSHFATSSKKETQDQVDTKSNSPGSMWLAWVSISVTSTAITPNCLAMEAICLSLDRPASSRRPCRCPKSKIAFCTMYDTSPGFMPCSRTDVGP